MYRSSSENIQFSWLLQRSCLLNETRKKIYGVEFLSIENLSIVTFATSDDCKRSVIVRKLLQMHCNRCVLSSHLLFVDCYNRAHLDWLKGSISNTYTLACPVYGSHGFFFTCRLWIFFTQSHVEHTSSVWCAKTK